MNKIYKVIWSKVKHQYVVVSELAHSNGKQSRTAKRSLRSRIAALVVCGAIAAFGVFGMTEQQAFAADGGVATQSQYIVIAVDSTNNNGGRSTRTFGRYTYHRQVVDLGKGQTKQYWVREGYDVIATEGERHDGINDNTNYIIDVKKNEDYTSSSDQGLLQAYQTTTSSGKITTLTGVNIEDLNTGVYGGASNSAGVETKKDFGYHIRVGQVTETDDGYVKVSNDLDGTASGRPAGQLGNTNWSTYFSTNIKLEDNGTYSFINSDDTKVTVPTNKIYSIDGQLGVFTDEKGNLYTGDVYGDNNEILLSGIGDNNEIYSYWGSKITDPTQTIGNMTVEQYNSDRKELQQQAAAYHGDDIKDITVTPNVGSNGGSLSFNRVGRYDEESGEYVPAEPAGVITFKNTEMSGKEGNDVAVEIGNGTSSFTVDAGSRVVGKTGVDGTTEANPNDTLTGIEINGQNYKLGGGKTYTDGDGISISQDDTNTISVNTGDGLKIENDKVVANVDGTTVKTNEQGQLTATTLDEKGSGVTATSTYGKDYAVKDTAGNTVTIEDIASATKLEEVAGEAEKHTSVSTNDANLKVENTAQKGDAANYEVTLNKDLAVNSVTAGGENGTVINGNGLTVAGTQYVSAENGLNAGGKKIQNVAEGVGDKDAVNVSQLKKAIGDIDSYSGWTVTTNGGETDEDKAAVGSNGTVDFSADDANITIDQDGTNLKFGLANDLNVNKITTNNMYVTNVDTTTENNEYSVINRKYFNENEQHINPAEYEVQPDGTVTMTYVDGNGNLVKDQTATIKGLTTDADLAAAKTEVVGGKNATVTANTEPTEDGHTVYTVDAYDTQIIGDGNVSVTGGEEVDENNVRNYNVKLNDVITVGTSDKAEHPVKIDGTSGQVTGLTNTDLKVEGFGESNRAATEEQLQAAMQDIDEGSYKGWTVSANGENGTTVENGKTVDFSSEDGNVNENKSTVVLAGTNGTTITNVANGINEKDAVNVSQLNAVDKKVNAGWTAKVGDDEINVRPNGENETGKDTLSFAGDNNITVTADTTNKAIQVALNDKVYLGGDHTEDSRNIVLDGERGVIGLGSNIALDGRDGTAVIGGVNITTTAEEGTGKPVSTINGLSNTTWTGTTETPNRAATEGQLEDLSDTVNTGWYVADKDTAEDSTTGNFAVKPGETLTFNGDDNIDVEAKDHKVNVSLKDNITLGEGNSQININGNPENGEAALSIGDKFVVEQNGTTTIVADDGINNRPSQAQLTPDTTVTIAPSGVTFAGDDKGTTIIEGQKITSGGIVINGEDIYDKTTGIVTKGTITGLSNTTWDGKTDNASRVATEGQLKAVSDDVNAGWIATDSQNHEVNITPDNNKLNFAGDENVTVTAANNEIKVALNDDIVLGDYLNGGDGVLIGGSSGTISATNSITVGEDQGLIIDGQKKEIQGLSNTTWNEDVANAVERDSVAASTAATQGQLQEVSKVANAGWNASDGTNSISVKPNETLNFVGDENLTVSADGTDKKLKVSLNDNITLGEGPNQIQLNGAPGANDPALSVGTDKFVVDQDGSLSVSDKFNVDAETGNIYAANNSGSAIMMNDDSVALNAGGNGIAISDEGILLNTNGINEDIKLVTKGTSVSVDSNGTTFTNVNTNETTNIDGGTINVGDKLVVDQDGTTTIAVNDGTVMGNNTTMTVNKDGVAFSAYGNGTTVIDGQTIYAGGVVINNNGSGTINGLTNTTWDDELAKQVANSEELQSTAATQGQLQQAVSEVAEVANAGWNAKAGGNTINVKPNETLNFEGDGNITVSATSGTSSELKFGLNHNITLDNVENEKTMMVFNTDGREGYIPDNYKEDNGQINDFIEEHGGFAIYYANPSLTTGDMTGTFGVTTDGVVHAKDVISYYSASSGSQSDVIRYSLNDVGDIVTQISHAVFDEGVGNTGMEYTLISDFEDEADKDSPFDAKEGKTRTIGLAVRQDGAVIVGAVVNDEGISRDRGIRINAETKTTYDKNGNEVTNNIATITGLENTEWKPPTPVATFAANDGSATVTSRAATESQLNDLYSAVAAYDVNVDGTIDYSHIALAGTPYGASRSGNGTHTGGTSITNVAYASGNDGSEAVNVDYLNDAINNAVKDGGAISDSDRHLQEGTYHVNDQGKVELIVADEKGENQSTVTIDNIANKNDITNLDNKIDNTFNDLNDKINNIDNVETDVKGGNINEDGTISLKTENEDGTTTNVTLKGQLTDSGVVQEGTSFDKETGTITITSQDKYSGETSSVKVEGIASTEVVGATNKEDLATAYKDADKDGNATTEYITDSESMVEADVALDHAIQDVAGTSYANDMVLSNRIDSVEKRLGNVEERIDKVGAMAAAIANLRTMGFDPEAPTEIAIGVGQYKSETGIAIGVFHYPNQDFMLSASLSSSGDELMGGIGATWKLGRKSVAERAKDEEARHLEQAEEMKKLAQQEKVKAQAQRHAKLLAERQQASQKNA